MKSELRRIAIHVLALAVVSGMLGVLLAGAPRCVDAGERGELALWPALRTLAGGWRLGLDFAGIGALLALAFLRAVPLPRAAAWIAAGMTLGALVGAGLAWSSEIRAWVVAYTIGGMTCGLVATCVRLWGAERATRGMPVRFGTLLTAK
jgi:hypothetical protein